MAGTRPVLRAYHTHRKVPQKLRVFQDFQYQIFAYGIDNVYPQKIEQIKRSSSVASQAVALFQNFVEGNGFNSEELAKTVANKKGETFSDLLIQVVKNYCLFGGSAIHLNYNLLGEIVGFEVLPFTWCRLGDTSKEYAYEVAVWNNWADEAPNNVGNTQANIRYLPCAKKLDDEEYRKFIDKKGGFQNFEGSIYYFSNEGYYTYPYSFLDPVINDAQTDAEFSIFRKNNVQNKFNASVIIRFFGETTEEDERHIREAVQEHQGSENAGNALLLFGQQVDENGKIITDMQLEKVESQNDDKLYINQEKSVNRNIVSLFRQPKVLHSLDDKGIFNSETLKEAYIYYNEVTRNDRRVISDLFKKLVAASIFADITDDYSIKENTYNSIVETSESIEVTPSEPTTEESITEELEDIEQESDTERQAQANLRGSVGGVQGILQVQQAVQNGTTSQSAAITILMEIFGFDEIVARKLLQ